MTLNDLLREASLLLLVLVPCVVIAERLRLGQTLALLAAGVLVGPSGLDLVSHAGSIDAITILGLVLVMFMVGLDLNPRLLGSQWLRLTGFALVLTVACSAVLTVLCLPLVTHWEGALLTGVTLSMSSAVLGIGLLKERSEMATTVGRTALAVFVVQSIAVFPVIMLIPTLNPHAAEAGAPGITADSLAIAVGALIGVVVVARVAVGPVVRAVARCNSPIANGAIVGLVVLAPCAVADSAGLPAPLGAYLVGLAVAASPEKTRVQTVVQPFQSLLLTLFIVGVGMSINLREAAPYWVVIVLVAFGVVVLKTIVTYAVARATGWAHAPSAKLGLLLAQSGECGFSVAAVALAIGWASVARSGSVILVIAITLAVTPILYRFIPPQSSERPESRPGVPAQ